MASLSPATPLHFIDRVRCSLSAGVSIAVCLLLHFATWLHRLQPVACTIRVCPARAYTNQHSSTVGRCVHGAVVCTMVRAVAQTTRPLSRLTVAPSEASLQHEQHTARNAFTLSKTVQSAQHTAVCDSHLHQSYYHFILPPTVLHHISTTSHKHDDNHHYNTQTSNLQQPLLWANFTRS